MAILNESLDFAKAPADVRRAFLGSAVKRRFEIGWEFYKFTHHSMFKADGTASPWWSSVEPLEFGDPGLAGHLARAGNLGVAPADLARARTAVTRQWNRMSGVLRGRLLTAVIGFVGRCASQPIDENAGLANVVFIGGAWQVWIPNLTRREIAEG